MSTKSGIRRLALAVAGSVALATSLGSIARAAEGKSIILLSPTEECTFCADYVRFFKSAAAEKGLKFEVTTTPFDPASQANQVEQTIAKKPDAIILWPVDANALVPSMRKIKQAGIPLVISDAPPNTQSEKYWDVFTGGDNTSVGKQAAHAMVDAFKAKGLGGEGDIFAITGTPGTPASIIRMESFKQELAAIAPGIKIVGEQPGNWDQSVATDAAAALFTKFGSSIKGVYSVEDVMMAGVIVASQRAGIDPKTLALVGVGCELPGYNNIEAGVQYATVLFDARSDALFAVNAVADLLDGKPQQKYVYFPVPVVTKDNLSICKAALGK